MSEVEELRRLGTQVVHIWEWLGECEDEFAPKYDPPACNEWRDALDTTIHELSRAIADHALERLKEPTRCTECGLALICSCCAQDVPDPNEEIGEALERQRQPENQPAAAD